MGSRTRRYTAWSSLVALIIGLAMPMLPGLHAATTGLEDCAALARDADLAVDANGTRGSASDHCVMCHWLRTARSGSMGPAVSADPAFTDRPLEPVPSVRAVSRLVDLEGPSRAPPAFA